MQELPPTHDSGRSFDYTSDLVQPELTFDREGRRIIRLQMRNGITLIGTVENLINGNNKALVEGTIIEGLNSSNVHTSYSLMAAGATSTLKIKEHKIN